MFENPRQIYIVLELCEGGNLYTRGPYSEMESATIAGQLLSAVKNMVRVVVEAWTLSISLTHSTLIIARPRSCSSRL